MSKVLIACEESQTVCKAFREKGHEAYSCDILECSGGKDEWHIQGDAIKVLYSQYWDLVIAHPPCTRLANSGVCWLTSRKEKTGYEWSDEENIYVNSNKEIWQNLYDACQFFNHFTLYGKAGNKIAIENTIQHKYAKRLIDKQTQVIQPYMFGHPEKKATCLWLYNLPNLKETDNVFLKMKTLPKNEQQKLHYLPPSKDRAKLRSKTFTGIALAMSEQWG